MPLTRIFFFSAGDPLGVKWGRWSWPNGSLIAWHSPTQDGTSFHQWWSLESFNDGSMRTFSSIVRGRLRCTDIRRRRAGRRRPVQIKKAQTGGSRGAGPRGQSSPCHGRRATATHPRFELGSWKDAVYSPSANRLVEEPAVRFKNKAVTRAMDRPARASQSRGSASPAHREQTS
jgi:hypothetical protein